MDFITLDDVANIIILVAPGYFAIRTYALVYSKHDKDFSRLLVESAIFSVPIVSVYNLLWRTIAHGQAVSATSARYVLPLLLVSIAAGWIASLVRNTSLCKNIAHGLKIPGADEDFIRMQFGKLAQNEAVSVTLQNGDVFSGTPQGGSAFKNGFSRQYYFNNIAWYNKKKEGNNWEERGGSLIVDLSEVRFIETPRPLPRD